MCQSFCMCDGVLCLALGWLSAKMWAYARVWTIGLAGMSISRTSNSHALRFRRRLDLQILDVSPSIDKPLLSASTTAEVCGWRQDQTDRLTRLIRPGLDDNLLLDTVCDILRAEGCVDRVMSIVRVLSGTRLGGKSGSRISTCIWNCVTVGVNFYMINSYLRTRYGHTKQKKHVNFTQIAFLTLSRRKPRQPLLF